MALSLPDNSPIAGKEKAPIPWLQWFTRINAFVNAGQQSGTTAQRPTTGVWIGRTYWDTDLGIPVYVASVAPIAWVDAAGNSV